MKKAHIAKFLGASFLLVAATCPARAAEVMIFTAPPTETAAEGQKLYGPIVKILSDATGVKWRYQRSRDWLSYVKFVVGDGADATFSQAHFAGYLTLYHNHQLLVRAPLETDWMLVGRAGSNFDLVGRPVCLIPPPELGSLIFTNQKVFEDPLRTPHVVSMDKREDLLPGLKQNVCTYTVLPANMVSGDSSGLETRLLSRVPGPAITVGRNVDDKLAQKIRSALLSPAGQAATAQIRDRFLANQDWIALSNTQPYLLASTMLVRGYLSPMHRMDAAFKVVQKRAEQVASLGGPEHWVRGIEPVLVPDVRAIRKLASNRILRTAVEQQNAKGMSLEQIKDIDKSWSGSKELTPFKLHLQETEAGTLLKQSVLLNPQYTELFLTDQRGANVAAYPATSDYWQGDEDKFTNAYNNGGRIFVGKQKFDESTKKVGVQVSVPVYSADNRVIGVLVAGLVVDYLRWKQRQTVAANSSNAVANSR